MPNKQQPEIFVYVRSKNIQVKINVKKQPSKSEIRKLSESKIRNTGDVVAVGSSISQIVRTTTQAPASNPVVPLCHRRGH